MRLQMRRLIGRWTCSVVVLFSLSKVLQWLSGFGLKPREDGWRRATRAFFRPEHAKFVLTAFHVTLWAPSEGQAGVSGEALVNHAVRKLAAFLKQQPFSHWSLAWRGSMVGRRNKPESDLVHAVFGIDGRLQSLVPHFDPQYPIAAGKDLEQSVLQAFIAAYNASRNVQDRSRPARIERTLHRSAKGFARTREDANRARQMIDRLLTSTFLHFEVLDSRSSANRFEPPDFTNARHPGQGMLNIRCRIDRDHREADFWVQTSHVAVDGVPAQEFMNRLKREWGLRRPLVYPASSAAVPVRYSTETAGKSIVRCLDFIDFHPLLGLRKKLNEEHGTDAGGEITLLSLLAWGLACHPAFTDRKFLFPIDLQAAGERERTIGLFFMRPSEYFDPGRPLAGFLRYQREFNRWLRETRERRSESYVLTESFALNPPWLYTATRVMMPGALSEMVGSVGISIIKDAEVFLGPVSDVHHDGFLAFGNVSMSTENSGWAGAVCVSGIPGRVPVSLDAIRQVASRSTIDELLPAS